MTTMLLTTSQGWYKNIQRKKENIMKKFLTLLACVLVLTTAVLMSACDDQGDTQDTTAATEAATEAVTEAATEEVTDAPATQAPATQAPETDAPATDAPAVETEAPETEAPETEAPATEVATTAPEVVATLNGKTPAEMVAGLPAVYGKNYTASNKLTMAIKMNMEGMNMEMEMVEDIWVMMDGNNVYNKAEASDGEGGKTVSELWYVDGVIYTEDYDDEFNPIKVRIEMTPEQVTEYGFLDLDDEIFMATPAAWLKNVSFEKVEDIYIVSVKANAQQVKEHAELLELAELEATGSTVKSMTQSYYFNADGSLAYAEYIVDMDMNGADCLMTNKIVVTEVGTTQVNAPANADQYQPITLE